MRKIKYTIVIFLLLITLLSCEKLLEPQRDNRLTGEQVTGDPAFAEGLLLNAYLALPTSYTLDEVATDDAVTNDRNSSLLRMATGEWKSTFNPMETWNSSYKQIYYINLFLEVCENVEWSWESREVNNYFLKKLKGEACGLRALYEFQILQKHAGVSADNELLGFPIVTNTLTVEDDLNLPRNTFDECVSQILNDCDTAIKYLPRVYSDTGDPEYDAVFGSTFNNRITGDAVRALKSRLALHAASPLFTAGKSEQEVLLLWEQAASYAADILSEIGGISGLSPTGKTFYLPVTFPGLKFDPDIIWRSAYQTNNTLENSNYPPTLFGEGNTNPSQNLVDAFPMANGYPFRHPSSGYDPSQPYANRDPRLTDYIVYNENKLRNNVTIYTHLNGTKDGINASTVSTRTGYYLRKFMNPGVNLDPVFSTNAIHFYTYFRYTEVFLNYAEAANEAWGPDADPLGLGFNARDVIAAIRIRAGITQPDQYLNSIETPDQMRQLIHNERRIELCFEGFRFWDLRRWKEPIDTPVNGVFISVNGSYSYDYQLIENRNYQPYMYYGPIPYNETLIYDLKQNMGW